MKKRVVSLLLCLIMALSLIPTVAFAAEGDAADVDTQQAGLLPPEYNPDHPKPEQKTHIDIDVNGTIKIDGKNVNVSISNISATLNGQTINFSSHGNQVRASNISQATINAGAVLVVTFDAKAGNTTYRNLKLTFEGQDAWQKAKQYCQNRDGYDFKLEYGNVTVPEKKIDIKVEKVWNDQGNADKRPSSITVNLLKNGTSFKSITLPQHGKWEYTFTDLAKTENGVAINYTVSEDEVKDYTTGINEQKISEQYKKPGCSGDNTPAQNETKTFVITNTYDPNDGLLTINKTTVNMPLDQTTTKRTFVFDIYKQDGTLVENGISISVNENDKVFLATKKLDAGTYYVWETETSANISGYSVKTTYADGSASANSANALPTDVPEGSYKVVITKKGTTTVNVTNAYTPNPGTDVNNLATVSVKKFTAGDKDKTQLADAQFKLEKKNAAGGWDTVTTKTTVANADLAFEGLHEGEYRLTETVAPAGHVLNFTPFTFTVEKVLVNTATVNNQTIHTYDYKITAIDGKPLDKEYQNTRHTFDIPNDKIATATANIGITKNVIKGATSSSNPGTATFTFKAEALYNGKWVSLACTGNTITTTGVGSKDGTIAVVIPTEYFSNNQVTVKITEVNDKQANWTYSTNNYEVYVKLNADGTTSLELLPNSSKVFTNTYTYTYTPPTRPTNPIRRQPTTTKPVESVKTGDMGIALYAVTSLLSLSGTALVIKKRKDEK